MNTLHILKAEVRHNHSFNTLFAGSDSADTGADITPCGCTASCDSLDASSDVSWWEESGVFMGVLVTDARTGMRQHIALVGHMPR